MNEVVKIDEKTEQQIRTSFLERIGIRIRTYREKRNISQDALGKCLNLHGSMISRIENGTTDTSVSNLQLISLYCDFPLSNLFIEDECREFLRAFSEAVKITARKYTRRKNREYSGRLLKGEIYGENGQEVIEMATIHKESEKEKYRQGIVDVSVVPIDPIDFYNTFADNHGIIDSVIAAGNLLNQIGDTPNRDTVRDTIAGYIIDELKVIKTPLDRESETQQRIYAYYKLLMDKYKNDCE